MGKLNVYLCIAFVFCTMCKKQICPGKDLTLDMYCLFRRSRIP